MTDAIWQAFAQTGDPVYYLLYKHVCRGSGCEEKNGKRSGEAPRP